MLHYHFNSRHTLQDAHPSSLLTQLIKTVWKLSSLSSVRMVCQIWILQLKSQPLWTSGIFSDFNRRLILRWIRIWSCRYGTRRKRIITIVMNRRRILQRYGSANRNGFLNRFQLIMKSAPMVWVLGRVLIFYKVFWVNWVLCITLWRIHYFVMISRRWIKNPDAGILYKFRKK